MRKLFLLLSRAFKLLIILPDWYRFRQANDGRFKASLRYAQPYLRDKTSETSFDLHYIYHPAWAARIIAHNQPLEHTDISSSLSFSTLLSAFVPVKFYDYRPAKLKLSGLDCAPADLCALPFPSESLASLSCLHTIEHIGLGRYGDPLDPDGDLKAISELKRVLQKGGDLLIAVPLGQPRLRFNAHRIYSYQQIISYFSDLELKDFSLISLREKRLIPQADPALVSQEDYGCGCFWFKKKI